MNKDDRYVGGDHAAKKELYAAARSISFRGRKLSEISPASRA